MGYVAHLPLKFRHALWCALAASLCGLWFSSRAESTEDAKALFDRGDYAAALALAEQGNAEAQYALGAMYAAGRGTTRDYIEAAKWIRRATESGFAPAQYDLALMYREGVGVARDDAQTMRWYRKAADQNFPDAQHNLGVRYERGLGVDRDDREAERWYRKAAEQGYPPSQGALGLLYANARGKSDRVEAYMWLSLAAEGFQGSQRAQVVEHRDQLAKALTPVQIAQAERLARQWRPINQWGSPYSTGSRAENLPAAEPSAVASGQLIDMGSHSLRAPLGEGWKLLADPALGLTTFIRGTAVGNAGWIVVTRDTLRPEFDLTSEEAAVAKIQQYEEASLRGRGATRSYAPGNVTRQVETFGEKKLYVMRYVITDRSRGAPIEVMYATCVYLPPNVKETRRVYLFIAGKLRSAEMPADTNVMPDLYPVIDSLREK